MQEEKQSYRPVIVGLDMGSWTMKISIYDGNQFQTLTNQANFRETPSLVAYGSKQRIIGEQAFIKMKTNFENTIRAPMRLIGIANNPHLVEQELRNCMVKRELTDDISFYIDSQSGNKLHLRPEQVLIALFVKARDIMHAHKLTPFSVYLALPTSMGTRDRNVVKSCCEVAFSNEVNLIDQWRAIATQYSYFRLKDIRINPDNKCVVFVDAGYSTFNVHAVQFTTNSARLIDQQLLRFTGCKNMDIAVTEFYANYFLEKTKQNVLGNKKALVKLQENVENQRRKLSANLENQIAVECLLNDEDLFYAMKRQKHEELIGHVLSEMATAMNNLVSRVSPKCRIESVELLGGGCRMPVIQNIIREAFGIQPSKTLNFSEAITRGCAIAGSFEKQFMKPNGYQVEKVVSVPICVAWNKISVHCFGENQNMYKNNRVVFPFGAAYPCSQFITIMQKGEVEIFAYYEGGMCVKSICYLRAVGPCRVYFDINSNSILNARLETGDFLLRNFHAIRNNKWEEMREIQRKMQEIDHRILDCYEYKNSCESLIYQARQRSANQLKEYIKKQENDSLLKILTATTQWLQAENERHLKPSATINWGEDLQNYQERINLIQSLLKIFEKRKIYHETIREGFYKFLNEAIAKEQYLEDKSAIQYIRNLKEQIMIAYEAEGKSCWENEVVTLQDLQDAYQEIHKIL